MAKEAPRNASTSLGAAQVTIRLAPKQDSFGSSTRPIGFASDAFYASLSYNYFPINSFVCPSLLLAMSSRGFHIFPPRGHIPPSTLRDRLNSHPCLPRRHFPVPRYVCQTPGRRSVRNWFIISPSHPVLSVLHLKVIMNTIRVGNRPPLIWMSIPAHKRLLVCGAVAMPSHPLYSRERLYGHTMIWYLELFPDNAKQDPVVCGAGSGVVFLAQRVHVLHPYSKVSICTASYHSGLKNERHFRLVVELTYLSPGVYRACAGPPGDFNGHARSFGNGAP